MKVGLNRSDDEHRVAMVRQQVGDDNYLVWFVTPVFSCSFCYTSHIACSSCLSYV